MSVTASSSSLVGFTLEDRYRVVREIGRGGMGIVYEAEHVQLGKRVAIKLMLDKYADDTEAVARFRREALAASTIGNSHIIDVSHIGKAPDGRPFVVMELLVGHPLSHVIEMTGPMGHWRAVAIMRQVLRAVGAAHSKGIVHRDLKPDNIFLVEQDDQRDFVKLLDFGISKMMDGETAIAHTKLTTTGMVMGTPLYMAPEQAMGTPIDHRADIYACGVILYEMLSGRPPFEGATYPVLIAKLLTAEPTPILERVPNVPARLVTAVHRALEKDPDKRWPSCDAFYSALPVPSSPSQIELAGTMGMGPTSLQMERVSLPVTTPPPTAAHPRSRAGLWIGLAAAGVAAAGAIAFVATRSESTPPAAGSAAPAPPPGPSVAPITPPPAPVAGSAAPLVSTIGGLRVDATPEDSAVAVDDVPEGLASRKDKIALSVGTHVIHVTHAGFAPHDEKIEIHADETTRLTVKLTAAREGGVPAVRTPPPPHTPPPAHTPPPVDAGSAVAPPPPPHLPPHDPPPHSTNSKPNPYGN